MKAMGWGWAGTAEEFLTQPINLILDAMARQHEAISGQSPSRTQLTAWDQELNVTSAALRECLSARPSARSWGVVLEYELPLEGGRRPDVVLLTGGSIAVLEFKSTARPTRAQVDQAWAYARDLADYHKESHGRVVLPILVLPNAGGGYARKVDEVIISGRDGLARYLYDQATEAAVRLDEWLRSPYEPLPTLVAAARRIFEHEPLPHVRRALAEGIPQTLDVLSSLVEKASENGGRTIAFVTGVPGAGKTLVGLRFVYERSQRGTPIFLSGNGPLVKVLQDALKSREFVRDLHAFIRRYGIREATPDHNVIVFDEAQRAWDEAKVQREWGISKSEPQLLIEIGARTTGWSALVGLVGEGQHIYVGEEAGLGKWAAAIAASGTKTWTIACPPHIKEHFGGLDVETHERLHLKVAMRARRAEDVHDWVSFLLSGSLALAARKAARFNSDAFQLFVTRDLTHARSYAVDRYDDAPDARYGLIVSSHANLMQFGVDNTWLGTRGVNIGRWFNAEKADPKSCCLLEQPVTEFQCQGLELDLPIVCWGQDVLWNGLSWTLQPRRRREQVANPDELLRNAYRVLLTRGRDGAVVWVPPTHEFDPTEHALLAAGLRPLPDVLDNGSEATA